MDGIGDELGTGRDVLFNGLMSSLIREIRRNHPPIDPVCIRCAHYILR